MIKENADWRKYNRPAKRHFLPERQIETDGVMNDYGYKKFQNTFMMQGNHNLLFGKRNGSPVGLCFRSIFTNRSMNTLVLSNGAKGWGCYVLPNLLAGHTSSVIVGADSYITKFISEFELKGINVMTVDFSKEIDYNNIREKLTEEKTYLFVSLPNNSLEKKLVSDFLSELTDELYRYGNDHWNNEEQALKNSVHFYLCDFMSFQPHHDRCYIIDDFLKKLCISRNYGIGYSIISQMWRIKEAYNQNEEWEIISANADTHLILSTGREDADVEYIQEQTELSNYSREDFRKMFWDEDKAIVKIKDCYPIICDTLKIDDFKSKES